MKRTITLSKCKCRVIAMGSSEIRQENTKNKKQNAQLLHRNCTIWKISHLHHIHF